jgi:hypothetical protein
MDRAEWKETDWTEEPALTRVVSQIICRLRALGMTAEAAEIAALLRPLSMTLDKSA